MKDKNTTISFDEINEALSYFKKSEPNLEDALICFVPSEHPVIIKSKIINDKYCIYTESHDVFIYDPKNDIWDNVNNSDIDEEIDG